MSICDDFEEKVQSREVAEDTKKDGGKLVGRDGLEGRNPHEREEEEYSQKYSEHSDGHYFCGKTFRKLEKYSEYPYSKRCIRNTTHV